MIERRMVLRKIEKEEKNGVEQDEKRYLRVVSVVAARRTQTRVEDNNLRVLGGVRDQGVDMEGPPAGTEFDMLLEVKVVLVAEKDNATLSDQGRELLRLLLGELRELDAMKLGTKLGAVVDALGDVCEEGLLLGVGALTGDAGGEGVAVGEAVVLLGGREDDLVESGGHCLCCWCCW